MITLSQVIPHPMSDAGLNPASDIFGVERTFNKEKRYLVTAPSGKGKSTLLHIIYGLRKDFNGKVKLLDKDLLAYKPNDWAELRQSGISIIFQDLRLFSPLSAIDNIRLKSNLAPGLADENRIQEMAALLGMTPFLLQKSETLSYGQRQRIAIIRALCQPFDFLLMDEPFSHLDEDNTRIACQLISEVCDKNNAGFILVSLGEEYPIRIDEALIL